MIDENPAKPSFWKRLKTQGECPVCQGPVSLLDGTLSQSPFSIRCRHCRSKNLVKNAHFGAMIPFMIVVGLLYGFFLGSRLLIGGVEEKLMFILALILVWLPWDALTSMYYYSFCKFTPDLDDPRTAEAVTKHPEYDPESKWRHAKPAIEPQTREIG